MKTKKQIKAFILKTLLPYKEDSDTCGYEGDMCVYLARDGKKCAVGKWMKKGEWQKFEKTVEYLVKEYKLSDILLKPAVKMEFTASQWGLLQRYHDTTAMHGKTSTKEALFNIEKEFGIELPELKV